MMPAGTRLAWAVIGWTAAFVASIGAAFVVVAVMVAAGTHEAGTGGSEILENASIGTLVLMQLPLWLGLLGTPLLARRRGLDWGRQLGWSMRAADVPLGAAVGVALQLVAVPLLYWPILRVFGDLDVEAPARELAEMAVTPFDVVLLTFMTVVMAAASEEVFFRGLLQGALSERLGRWPALIGASVIFGITHFQVVQLPALVLVGLVNGYLVMRTGRLGPALWSHAAFNAVTVIALVSL